MLSHRSVPSRALRIAAAFSFALSITAISAAAQCTIEWTGASSGNWSDAGRWSTGSVPSDSDVVCIQTSGTYTVTVTGNRTITSLRLGGNSGAQTLSVGSGTVTLTENGIVGTNGVINFVSGNLDSGPGLTNEGLVVLTSSSSKTLGGRLINDGTIRWDQGHIYLTTNAVLENNDQFLVGGHSNGIYRSGSAPQRFVNNATINRTADGTSSLNLTLENNGLIDVQSGTLQVRGESYHNGGSFGVATGASLLFDSGTHTVSGTLSGNPDGSIVMSSTVVAGSNGAVFNFGGTGLKWSSGNLDGGPGLTNDGLVVLTSSSNKTLGGRLINDGTIRWDQGHIYLTTNAVLENNDQFLVGGHSNGIYRSGSAPQRFVNNATINRTADGTSSLNLTLENNGLIDVQSGTLQVRGESYHNGGSFGVATGASLLFDSGTHTVSGTLSGNPDGSIVMSSTVVAGSNGAVFNFGGTGLKWSSGNLDGGPGLTNDGLVVLTSSSNKTLGGRLINDGTIRWDQGHIYLTTNAVLENNDQFLVGGHSNGIYRSGSAPQRFVNNATINRTADGTSSLNLTLENNGLIDVQSGTLQVRGESYHNGGSFGVATGASLLFDSGTHTVSGTLSGNPDGSIVMSSTVVAGSNGAVFNFGGTGLKWSSGNLDGGPGLTNDGLVVLTSSSNKTLGGRLINDGTIRWDQGHIYLTTNAVLENNDQFLVGGHSNGIYRSGSAPQRFVNNATINRTADGTSSLNLPLETNGLVDVQAGTLQIRDESYHDDARLITAADASLLFYSGTHTVSGSFEGTSAGVIAHSSNMIIEPATVFSFDDNGFQWRSGTLDGGSGLTNEGLIVLASASNKTLRGHLINDGTIRWNQGHIYLATGAVIENRETFRAATTHGIYPSGSAPQRFQNLGTLLKDEPQTTSTIDIEFDNRGSLAVSEGTLRFSSQSEHTNVTLDVRPDATLEFSRGTHFLTDVGLVVPTGATLTFGSGTHIITGTLAGDVEGLVQWTSGTMQAGSGGGTINIAGSGLQWQRGTISTTDNIFTNRGDIHIVGPAAKSLTAGTLRNEGMIEWIGGSFDINRDGILENMGSMLVKVEIERMGPAFSEAGALLNYGRFEKQAGEERVEIYPRFENKSGGNLAIHAGELRFRSLHNAPGAEISGDGGSFLVAASEFLNEGIVTPGASPGLLSYTGTYRSARSAELQIEIAGLEPGVSHDQIRLTGSC